jgi:Uma2 family endonuclease
MGQTPHITTAEQLLHAGDIGRCELIRGNLIMMSPAGFEHGVVIATLTLHLGGYVKQHGLGVVCGAETGFLIERNPDTVRAPDIAFVRTDRLEDVRRGGFGHAAPDLAVEVLSRDDRPARVREKVQQWLASGCRAVWAVDPRARTITIHRAGGQVVLDASQELTGGDVLPGFVLPVFRAFEDLGPA